MMMMMLMMIFTLFIQWKKGCCLKLALESKRLLSCYFPGI